MKTACAWCGKTIGLKCDACGQELAKATVSFLDEPETNISAYVCPSRPLRIIHIKEAEAQVSHGICHECFALTEEQRDALASEKKRGPTGVPKEPTFPREDNRKKEGIQ